MILPTLAALFWSYSAFAFPELSRHGYVNCTSCHVSPSGSGLLNEYGRGISKDLLSHWAREGEEKFAYGLVSPPERLVLGAYFRGLQLHQESITRRVGRPILMQADLEAGYVTDELAVVGTVGRQEFRDRQGVQDKIVSRRHYALYRLGDTHHFRAGRFQKFFGLNDANHFLATRRDLRMGQDMEAYNAEYAFLGEAFSAYVTGMFGNFKNSRSANKERGVSVSGSYFWAEKQKIGVSALQGSEQNPNSRRTVAGVWGVFSWLPSVFTTSELDFQAKRSGINSQNGWVTSQRVHYEVTQGLIPYMLWERSHLDRNLPASLRNTFGAGIQFFPRPHFELVANWQQERLVRVSDSSTDLLWLMLNFYL